jgi:hypothetical protein
VRFCVSNFGAIILSTDTINKWLLIALTLLVVCPLGIAWSGFVISYLWLWFIVPIFHMPPLNVASAVGLALVVQTLRPARVASEEPNHAEAIGTAIVFPGWMLLVGWILKAGWLS